MNREYEWKNISRNHESKRMEKNVELRRIWRHVYSYHDHGTKEVNEKDAAYKKTKNKKLLQLLLQHKVTYLFYLSVKKNEYGKNLMKR